MSIWQKLKHAKKHMTAQQYRTIKGQLIAGDTDGALKGLHRLLQRKGA